MKGRCWFMDALVRDVLLIFALILANGFFSGAELAVISARRGTINRLSASGDRRAQLVAGMQKASSRFLATVQVGVTVIGTLASALAGAAAADYLRPFFLQSAWEPVRRLAEPLSLGIVVSVVSYLLLVVGELAPKTIGLQSPDKIALAAAKPLHMFSRLTGVAVSFLTVSSRLVLGLFGFKANTEQPAPSREEILDLTMEGGRLGVLTDFEHNFIRNTFGFIRRRVHEIMVPRVRITMLDLAWAKERIISVISATMYSRYPVYRETPENIIGFVHTKELLLAWSRAPGETRFDRFIRPVLFVPRTEAATLLIRQMQRQRRHMAMVVDEYGGIEGLVTAEDLLEELVGEIEDEFDINEFNVRRLAEGDYSVNALIPIADVEKILGLKPQAHDYHTLAGLLLKRMGRIPKRGERMTWQGFQFICEESTLQAIQRVRITRQRPWQK